MKRILWAFPALRQAILLCGGLLLALGAAARETAERTETPQPVPRSDEDYVLILNAYSELAPWSRSVIDSAIAIVNEISPQTMVLTHHLNTVLIHNEYDLEVVRRQIDSSYRQAPRMVVYVGSIGWVLFHESIERKWETVPAVVLANVDFVGPKQHYLDKTAVPADERTPFSKIVESRGGRLSVICYPTYVRETMALMERLIPGMENMCFISDGSWLSAQMRSEVAWAAKTDSPKLEVGYLTATQLSTSDLIDSLRSLSPETGVLYFSWIKQTKRGRSVVDEAPYGMIGKYAHQPLFVLEDIEVSADGDIIGGYFVTLDTVARAARQAIAGAFDGMPGYFGVAGHACPVFDYTCISRAGFDAKLLPDNTFFYWKPPGFLRKYLPLIIGSAGVCLVLFAVIVLLWRKRQQQHKALAYMTQYHTLFDNMPIAYARLEVRYGERGEVADLIVRNVNPLFEREFFMAEGIVGRGIGGLNPSLAEPVRRLASAALDERRKVTELYYSETTGKHYEVFFSPDDEKRAIDIFLIDNTSLFRIQERLRRTNRRLASVLDAAGIVPWSWELRSGKIEYGPEADDAAGEMAEVSVRQCSRAIRKEDCERVREAFRQLIEGDSASVGEVFRVVRRGTLHYDRVEVRAVVGDRDEAGKPVSLVGSWTVIER